MPSLLQQTDTSLAPGFTQRQSQIGADNFP